jgi:hypothetical protein
VQYKEKYLDLLVKYARAISIDKNDLGRTKHFFQRIHLKGNAPIYRKKIPIPEAHTYFIEATLEEWLKIGVVRRSKSIYNAPIFCVPKKSGQGLYIVQDFRELNNQCHIDKYSMKEINECIGEIGHANISIPPCWTSPQDSVKCHSTQMMRTPQLLQYLVMGNLSGLPVPWDFWDVQPRPKYDRGLSMMFSSIPRLVF